MMNNKDNADVINVYTDANPSFACIAIEKNEKHYTERRFDLIVIQNKCKLFFEADAVRIALTYLPDNSKILLHCDKEGDIVAIRNGKSNNNNFQEIINKIKLLEQEKNLSVEYKSIPRKKGYAGRIIDKIIISGNQDVTSG